MSDNAPVPEGGLKDAKQGGRQRWRDKLFSNDGWRGKDEADRENNENEVTQFLSSSTSRPNVKQPGLPVGAPRLNTSDTPRQAIAPSESDLSPIQDSYKRPRPRLNKGLTVNFVKAAPIIIGEGGDEAKLPASEIAKSLERLEISRDGSPSPLQRRSTGVAGPYRSDLASQDIEAIKNHAKKESELTRSYSSSQSTHNSRADTQIDRGQEQSSAPKNSSNDRELSPNIRPGPALEHGHSTLLNVPSPELAVRFGNSLTPTPSPQPHGRHRGQSSPERRFGGSLESGTRFQEHDQISRKPQESARIDVPHQSSKHPSISQGTKGLANEALDEFDTRVRSAGEVFRLGVNARHNVADVSFSWWIRAAAWWFLKGRQGLETAVRGRSRSQQSFEGDQAAKASRAVMQAHVNLSKAWWIIKEISPDHADVKKYGDASMSSMLPIIEGFGDKELIELVNIHTTITANLRALAMSMKRNGRLPPQPFQIQGLDTSVLLECPNLPRHVVNINSDIRRASNDPDIVFPLPIGDSRHHFSLGRMFVKGSLVHRGSGREEARIECLISNTQSTSHGGLTAFVASQDGQVHVSIGPDEKRDSIFTWRHIQWMKPSHSISLALSRDLGLEMSLTEMEFEYLWEMCDSYQKARRAFHQRENEILLFDCVLRHFERLEMPKAPGAFPQGPVQGCQLRLFSKKPVSPDSVMIKDDYTVLRLVVMTPPSVKSLHTVSTDLGGYKAILLGSCEAADGPSITIRTPDSPALLASFRSQDELDTFRVIVDGTLINEGESLRMRLPLQKMQITSTQSTLSHQATDFITNLSWRQLRVVKERLHDHGHDESSTQIEILRLLANCGIGCLVDRLNLKSGDLLVSFDVDKENEIKFLCPPQFDVAWTFEDRFPKEILPVLGEILKMVMNQYTIRTLSFPSLNDAHQLLQSITGFSTLYDSIASSFSISRRRSVMPIHKRWEASIVRLQVLRRDKSMQLAAYFKDFAHGTCLNFELKAMDVLEVSSRSGAFLLRIVDAKFALPKGKDDPNRDFLCLNMPEYPTEHDDVTIGFESEEARNQFTSCLPAPVSKASRLGSLRR